MKPQSLDRTRRDRMRQHALTFFGSKSAADFFVHAMQSRDAAHAEEFDHDFDRWQWKAGLVLLALFTKEDISALVHYVDLLWEIQDNWAKGINATRPVVDRRDQVSSKNRRNSRLPRPTSIATLLLDCLRAAGGDANPTVLKRQLREHHPDVNVVERRPNSKTIWEITLPNGERGTRNITDFLYEQRRKRQTAGKRKREA